MYVAVKGGEKVIAAAHALLARERRGDVQIPEVTLEQLAGQLKLAVDRIMAEGSLYSPELAANPLENINFRSYQLTIIIIRSIGPESRKLCRITNQCISRGSYHLPEPVFRVYQNYQYQFPP